ncbi:MAG: hypothetical protein U0744_18405 [Gemmataceae bacterium]
MFGKVLPRLYDQIDSSLVGLDRECDDLIPLQLPLVGTLCLLFDSVDNLKGRTLLGQSPDQFGSGNKGSVLCGFHFFHDFTDK